MYSATTQDPVGLTAASADLGKLSGGGFLGKGSYPGKYSAIGEVDLQWGLNIESYLINIFRI